MTKLLKYVKNSEWGLALVSLAFIICQVWLDLKMPEYMTTITQIVTAGEAYGTMSDILTNGGYMLACALGSMGCSILAALCISRISADFSARLREKQYIKVQSFSAAEINKFSTASLITRTTNDVQQVQMLIAIGLQIVLKAPITAVWAIVKIAGKEWQWSVATAVAVVIMFIGIIIVLSLVINKFRKLQRLTDNLNRVTRENLTGIRVVRAYNAEAYQKEKFEEVNTEFTTTNLFTNRVLATMSPAISGICNFLTLAIYWIGAVVIAKTNSILEAANIFSDMTVFLSYGMQILAAFMMFVMIFMLAPRALVSARRINEVLDTEVSLKDGNGVGETKEKGTIEFKNVSFGYPDASEYALQDISFKCNKGDTLAFIGATGSGKSTLINLISRFYDVSEGEVLVDGHNVKEYTKEELNNKIGYVSQKAILFSGNIRSNIDFGDNNADDEKIKNVLEIAQASSFVNKKEDGTNSRVAQGGANFSGGQKQRLSIARAVARDAEIYIFDDTFSALDYKTDRELRDALEKKMGDRTRLIVAQRIGTIKDADCIYVLEEGRIVGNGKHKDLIKNCPAYLEIAKSQLSEEEIANV